MGVPKRDRWMWLRRKLFVLSPAWFAAILVFQQLFDLVTTLYLTSLPGGQEANPLLAAMWDAPGGPILWMSLVKFWACVFAVLGVPYLAREAPGRMWAPKIICLMYWLLAGWNGFLVASTML